MNDQYPTPDPSVTQVHFRRKPHPSRVYVVRYVHLEHPSGRRHSINVDAKEVIAVLKRWGWRIVGGAS